MSIDDAWIRGFVDGFRSVSPGTTPSVPARPGEYPASLRIDELEAHFYRLGYEAGKNAAGD